ncbi:MAG: hypothetical protein U0892_05715 [Pirellulales bacterium]
MATAGNITEESTADRTSRAPLPWLFSAELDLSAFLGSALVSVLLLLIGFPLGLIDSETPDGLWIALVLMIDVAHVYSTGFRVYFDRAEVGRRPWLYTLTPISAYVIGVMLFSIGPQLYWRCLAYLAVFHFVRQQYGWVALYRSKENDRSMFGWWIDSAAIYSATLYPLIYWHAHLPRSFAWFMSVDFVSIPAWTAEVALAIYGVSLSLYTLRSGYRAWFGGRPNPGKDIVVFTTAFLWYIGIITFDSDYAFTVTNVVAHGVPYMILVLWVRDRTHHKSSDGRSMRWLRCLALIWILAYLEEFFWDVGVWHDRPWLFGEPLQSAGWRTVLTPILAVPQITHYVLDGFIWKRQARVETMEA